MKMFLPIVLTFLVIIGYSEGAKDATLGSDLDPDTNYQSFQKQVYNTLLSTKAISFNTKLFKMTRLLMLSIKFNHIHRLEQD